MLVAEKKGRLQIVGQLWVIEMGPRGGDELNRIVRGANYGYPLVSNGQHYDGRDIPDHDTNLRFEEPVLTVHVVQLKTNYTRGLSRVCTGDGFPDLERIRHDK
jgi:glucose/arabinose dehydrogenase